MRLSLLAQENSYLVRSCLQLMLEIFSFPFKIAWLFAITLTSLFYSSVISFRHYLFVIWLTETRIMSTMRYKLRWVDKHCFQLWHFKQDKSFSMLGVLPIIFAYILQFSGKNIYLLVSGDYYDSRLNLSTFPDTHFWEHYREEWHHTSQQLIDDISATKRFDWQFFLSEKDDVRS